MEYTIRAMRPDDIGAVAALLMRAFFDQSPDVSLLHGDFVRLYFDEPAAVIRIAEQDERLLGVVFGHCWGSWGWLGPVAVSPAARRTGIGRTLVTLVMQEMERRGCTAMTVDTAREEHILTPFYERLCFRPVMETTSFIKRLDSFQAEPCDWQGSEVDAGVFDRSVQELCRAVVSGMDLLPLIELWRARGWGDGLLLQQQGEPVALAVVMHRPRYTGESAGVVRLCALLQLSSRSLPDICSLLAKALCRRYPSARYLYIRDDAVHEAAWLLEGWSRQGHGQRWAYRALSTWPANALLCME